jgi:tRNA A-37 threonylcarbamoyl transferase component Bud32
MLEKFMQLIGRGAQADVYKDNFKAIKLFKYSISKEEVENEFNLQKKAFNYGLPVPNVFDIIEIESKLGFTMELIDGESFGKIIFKNIFNVKKYLIKSIKIQDSIHKIETKNFPNMKEKLKNFITCVKELNSMEKERIILKLEKMNFDNKLCHGDFHIYNLIQTSNEIKIIDWICASSGTIEADVYRTYLLYRLFNRYFAEMYLNTYCKLKKLKKRTILEWAPVIAAARLGEFVKNEKEKEILLKIIKAGIKTANFSGQ